MEEILEVCKVCGQPRLIRRDGDDISKTCNCGRNEISRAKFNAYVGLNFQKVYMNSWNPKPLREEGPLAKFMEYQKAAALVTLWNMYYKEDENKVLGIQHTVSSNTNLFIRAPDGCGKGMMAATAKKVSCVLAKRGEFIEMSPAADDFGTVKRWLFVSNMFAEGREARDHLERFSEAKFMVIQDITVETSSFKDKDPFPVKNSIYLDGVISHQQQKGAFLMTSNNFIGEIKGHLGSVAEDVLLSPKTKIVVLLLAPEIMEIEKGIEELKRKHVDTLRSFRSTKDDERISAVREEQRSQELELVFYFMHAFSPTGRADDDIHLLEGIELKAKEYPAWVTMSYKQFCNDKENKTPTYQRLLDEAFRLGVQQSRFGQRMSPKEAILVGKMLARFKDSQFVEKICALAKQYQEEML